MGSRGVTRREVGVHLRSVGPSRAHRPVFVGQKLWLDFANTILVEQRHPVDLLTGFPALVAWLRAAGTIESSKGREALREWGGTRTGEDIFREALRLRGALRKMGERLAAGRAPEACHLAAINRVLRRCSGYRELARRRGRYVEQVRAADGAPIRLLGSIALSASDFLCRADLTLVRRCANPRCVLSFYDTTKNHGRRFCSPATCGNRMKAAARYRRLRERRGTDGALRRR